MEYDNGKRFTLRELQYHDADKVSVNVGCEGVLPKDWLVETSQERADRIEKEIQAEKEAVEK